MRKQEKFLHIVNVLQPRNGKDFGKKWANDLYQNAYEPGSTFKSYGLAAAIQEGKFNPKENMNLVIVILWFKNF